MKAYLGIKFHADNRNRKQIESVSQALGRSGFETVCIQRDVEKWGAVELRPSELMAETFAVIRECDLVVIELSEKGVGLGIEAGYAHALGLPIVVVAEHGRDVSTTLRGIAQAVCFYDTAVDLELFFRQYGTR